MPSTDHLFLLSGWAMDPSILAPLTSAMTTQCPSLQVTYVDLPDTLSSRTTLEEQLALLKEEVESNHLRHSTGSIWLCGWSLGGMLATALAHELGSRISGLITLASNARFTASDDWSCAMPTDTFKHFSQSFEVSPAKTLKRFSMLCSQGAQQPRDVMGQLSQAVAKTMIKPEAHTLLTQGLDQLEQLDNRLALTSLTCPQLHLYGRQDALVPETAVDALTELLQPTDSVEIDVCEGGHTFPIGHAEEVGRKINEFIMRSKNGACAMSSVGSKSS